MNDQLQTKKLGDPNVADVILGQSPPSSTYNDKGDGLPFFQGKADFGLLHPVPRMWCNDGQKFAERGDVLMSVRAPVGDVNIATNKCVIGRGVAAIRASSNVDSWFLYFALLYSKPILEARATGSTFASVNKTTLHDLEIPFVARNEQAAIGTLLRQLVLKVEQENHSLDTTTSLKQATMRELFTRGLRGEAQKETEIGLVPESWEAVRLGSVCVLSTGTTPSTKDKHYYEGTIPFIKTADVINNRISSAVTFISQQAVEDYSLKLFPPGTVLMAMYGQGKTRGQVSLLEIAAATTQNAAAIQPLKEIDSVFLWHYLLSCYERLRGMGSLGHLSHLNLGYLRDLLIIKPSLDEQRKFAEILDALDRKIILHQQKRAILEELFKSLLHKLMTGEIRVSELNLATLSSEATV